MDKTALAVNAVIKGRVTAPPISEDQVACANCRFVHMNPDLTWACWKAPPTAAAAFVPGPRGELEVKVCGARPPVERDAYCGEFVRKTVA
jgi:hypothetical protein